jgi:hypothetical protein
MELEPGRQPYLDRGREASELTIPALLPRDGHNSTSDLPTPYQGLGARGVNNLASKLLMALLPPSNPFFRLQLSDFALQSLTGGDGSKRTDVEKALGEIERAIMSEIETSTIRVSAFEGLKHLMVVGNALLYLPPDGGMRVYSLDRYVCKRDAEGNLLELVTKESISPSALPKEITEQVPVSQEGEGKPSEIDVYTWVRRDGNKVYFHQEALDIVIDQTKGNVPIERSPWIALRWAKIDGEDYGRGHVEEYLGDLRSLEGLTTAVVQGSAAASKLLMLVNPNGLTRIRDISEAPNLAVRSGRAEDVSVLQFEKYADFRVALEMSSKIEQRLAQAFMLFDGVRRDAERVTAEEIRITANELEDALGGVYSILAQELQLPMVRRLIATLTRQKRIPPLPKEVEPTITTGLEALGRGHELQRLMTFGDLVQRTLGPEAFAGSINPQDFIARIGVSLGIDMDGLVKSAEQIAQERQAAQRQQMVQQLGPEAMKMAQQQAQQNPQQQQP